MNVTPQMMWIAAAVAAGLIIIFAIAAGVRRSRTAQLREHFGTEYDHAVKHAGSRTAAEQELVARAEEVKSFDIRPLTASQRERYRSEWKLIEQRFVDRPTTAVVEADELVADVMRTRGYPMADWEKHAAHLSVKHPRVVEHYRAGHAVIDEHARGKASTEDLRQAMLHYRSLFEELANDGVDVERELPMAYETEADRERRRLYTSDETRPDARPR